jgi:uncharacterized protein YuzE
MGYYSVVTRFPHLDRLQRRIVEKNVGQGQVDRTEEAGPFIYDVDADGRVVGIEILSASKVLVPGEWKKSRSPGESRVGAAG